MIKFICIFWLMLPSPRQYMLHFSFRWILSYLDKYTSPVDNVTCMLNTDNKNTPRISSKDFINFIFLPISQQWYLCERKEHPTHKILLQLSHTVLLADPAQPGGIPERNTSKTTRNSAIAEGLCDALSLEILSTAVQMYKNRIWKVRQ